MAIDPSCDIDRAFSQGTAIDAALNHAVRDAVREHQRMGLPLAAWREGKTVWVRPEEFATEADSDGSDGNDTHGE